jgi:hypothetical protein
VARLRRGAKAYAAVVSDSTTPVVAADVVVVNA